MNLPLWISRKDKPARRSAEALHLLRSERRRPLLVEVLEDRCTPAIVVNTELDFADDSNAATMSLREAVSLAQTGSDHEIQFDASLAGKTIRLNSELSITGTVSIVGLGQDQLTISGDNASDGIGVDDADGHGETRLFNVKFGGDLDIRSVTLV